MRGRKKSTAKEKRVIPAAEVRPIKALPGMGFGLRQPAYLLRIVVPPLGEVNWEPVDALIGGEPPAGSEPLSLAFARRALSWACALMREAGLPVFEEGRILHAGQNEGRADCLAALPYPPQSASAAIESLEWSVDRLSKAASSSGKQEAAAMAGTRAELIAKLAAQAVQSTNSLHFLRTAHQRDIPWQLVSQPVYRLGWGHRSRWLDSTLTDRTPGIGVGLAHNKHRSAELLNRLGLPVPSHAVVSSADSAERHAAALGYPVVVKPVDTDGGRGVTTNLCSPEAVRAAFATAAEHSTKVMVQKHVGGRDYRLTVFQGRLVWAIMRAPGGVTGDGSHDVAELVERLNAGRYAAKMLHLDAAALDLLAEQGLTRDSVPEPGQFVRLRTAANVTQGGTAVAVLDQVHPDNRILAERVAAAFRLDIAGIDLLIDDISRSWMETGAYICEVNAQPQLGITTQQHLYGAILDELVPHGGRIPTAVIVGAEAEKMAADILRRMGGSRAAGTASSGGAWIGGRQVLPAQAGLHAATQLLLSSTDVELALVAVSNDAVLKSGLAFDRYDLLVVAGAGPSWLPATVEMVEPNNAGPTLFAREDPALPTFATAKKIRNLQAVGGASEGLARAASLLLQQRLQPGTASGA